MPRTDLPLDELRLYEPEATEPPDLDAFWAQTLAQARSTAPELELGAEQPKLAGVSTYQVRFRGLDDAPIADGWRDRMGPALIPGSSTTTATAAGGRPLELYPIAAQGMVVLSMDCRGQDGDSPTCPPWTAATTSVGSPEGFRTLRPTTTATFTATQ